LLALWVALCIPFGLAMMVYATSHPRDHRAKTAILGSVAMWFLITLGMTGWAVGEFSIPRPSPWYGL
jgi:hypothetical protein